MGAASVFHEHKATPLLRYIARCKWSYFNSKLPTFLVTIITMGRHLPTSKNIVVVDVFEVSVEGLQG